MSDDTGTFDRIEFRHLDDILACETDTSHPLLLTKTALDAGAADLLACDRELVARSLDRAASVDEVSQDALRASYVDLYRSAIRERGWAWYRQSIPRPAQALALQGISLMSVPDHLDLIVHAIEDSPSDESFAAAFDAIEATQPLEAAVAEFLRDRPTITVLAEDDIETALSIEFSGTGVPAAYPRWRGDLGIFD